MQALTLFQQICPGRIKYFKTGAFTMWPFTKKPPQPQIKDIPVELATTSHEGKYITLSHYKSDNLYAVYQSAYNTFMAFDNMEFALRTFQHLSRSLKGC